MTTHNMPTNTNMEELPEKEIIAGHQARLTEIKKGGKPYLVDGINPCPSHSVTFEVSISV